MQNSKKHNTGKGEDISSDISVVITCQKKLTTMNEYKEKAAIAPVPLEEVDKQ